MRTTKILFFSILEHAPIKQQHFYPDINQQGKNKNNERVILITYQKIAMHTMLNSACYTTAITGFI